MKKIKKQCLLLAALLAVGSMSAFVGCGPKGEEVDDSKSQLYVGNLYAGWGNEWLYKWKEDFEAKYADTSFESGKTGVQIWIDDQRDAYSGKSLLTSIASQTQDMYFTEDAYYYDYVAQDACAEITDIVTEDLSAKYGESGSIADKMNPEARDYYNLEDGETDRYYMLPVNETYFGIMYDVDLFMARSFFVSNQSTATSTKFTNNKEMFAAGPDGQTGTYDDGLPATYAQFYDLMKKMKDSSITPFIWGGKYASTYGNRFMESAWAAADGVAQMNLNYTLSGSATTLVESITTASKSYDGKTYDTSTVTLKAEPTTITDANANILQKQAGKYYALQLVSNIVKDETNFDSLAFSGSTSHTGAQTEYLYSANNPNKQRIAMLLDGTWWRPEAKATFENMAVEMGEDYSMANRNFGLMPVPKPTADMVGTPNTYITSNEAVAFVSAYCPANKLKLAKEFLQFCFTNNSMKDYTRITDATMPYAYSFTDETEKASYTASLTTFGQQMMAIHDEGHIVRGYSSNQKYINNYSYFADEWDWRTTNNTSSGKYPFTMFHEKAALTAKEYFEGCYAHHLNNNLWN